MLTEKPRQARQKTTQKRYLTDKFLANYGDAPDHMKEIGSFVFYRTYSRWVDAEGRRETWKETVTRSVEYSIRVGIKQLKKSRSRLPQKLIQQEAEELFDNMFNLRQFLSGRTLWVGGAESGVADRFPLANFNCSFLNISSWKDFGDLFYLSLVGAGVGFKSTKEMAHDMAPVRRDYQVIHQPFVQRYPIVKEAKTGIYIVEEGTKAVIHVGDSKEGWVEALNAFFDILTNPEKVAIKTISIHYDFIRPKGTKLKVFGGTASGYQPIQAMFEGIERVLKDDLDTDLAPMEKADMTVGDTEWFHPRPVHMLDIGNLIGNNVVSGGVRRTAEIFLCDPDDWESILAKYGINGIWDKYNKAGELLKTAEDKHNEIMDKLKAVTGEVPAFMRNMKLRDENARPLHHRRLSNNTVAFDEKPTREVLDLIVTIMENEGEPGIFNLTAAKKRRVGVKGMNPCGEIMLDSYGVCNLTTVNVAGFVHWNERRGKFELDYVGLMRAQRLSARAGVRMTTLDLELPHWNKVHHRDALIGTSLTGWYDAMDMLEYGDEEETQLLRELKRMSRKSANEYADMLGTTRPLLDTTVKPEGTLSQVAGGVSSGLHRSHAAFYIRRIRINAKDPLANAAKALGWTAHAEVGTEINGEKYVMLEDLAKPEIMEQANTLVIDFPVKSGAKTVKEDVFVEEQFETYFRFQENYTAHNSSNTIHVRPDEWEKVKQILWDEWDRFVACSFLDYDGGSYTLAPYETITEKRYNELRANMQAFRPEILQQYENDELDKDMAMALASDCEGGACPVI